MVFEEGEPHIVGDQTPRRNEDFTFQLCHRPEVFGEIAFEQWWMDIRTIYQQRNTSAVNFEPLVDFWWRTCVEYGTNQDRDVCESYLLAKLLPRTRTNGSRRVLIDSIPPRLPLAQRNERAASLEFSLESEQHREKTLLEFYESTRNFIGPPVFEQDVHAMAAEFNEELFETAVPSLIAGNEVDALSSAVRIWERWQQRYGRRQNVRMQKDVMDVLSYEARAAIHRSYSHLWMSISRWLNQEQNCTPFSFIFHRFWHLDLSWPSNEFADQNFHLFHGHIFALHPGTHVFMQTRAGRRLVGEWLAIAETDWQSRGNPETPQLRRLLHGLAIAIIDYSTQHGVANYMRRGVHRQIPDGIDISDATQGERSRGQISGTRRRGRNVRD